MKLKTLAAAIAVASMPFAAHSAATFTGDVAVGYFSAADGTDRFGTRSNNMTFKASEKIGGLTYSGQADFDFANGVSFTGDDIRVGIAGGFGTLSMGDTDNGCDATDIGGTNEVWETHSQGGCMGSDNHNITYSRGFGNFTGAISHNPDAETTALGVKGSLGPVGVSFGYETDVSTSSTSTATAAVCPAGSSVATNSAGGEFCVNTTAGTVSAVTTASVPAATTTTSGNNIVLGLTGKVGPVSIGFRANKFDSGSAVHGINAMYSRGAHNVYGGLGTSSGNDSKSIGYKHVRGNTDFVLEAADSGASGSDTAISAAVRHRF